MSNYYEELTNQYSVSKTICNKLKPIGKTLEHIKEKQIIETDKKRAEDYIIVKNILDEFHFAVINESLSKIKFSCLVETAELYFKAGRTDSEEKVFEKNIETLRKEIAACFKNHEGIKYLGKKELFSDVLPKYVSDENKEIVASFNRFTTYFRGYSDIRSELYLPDEKSSTVAYRLINENYFRFLDNIRFYLRMRDKNIDVKGYSIEEIDKSFMPEAYVAFVTQEQIDNYNKLIGNVNLAVNLFNQKNKERLPKFKELYKLPLSEKQERFIPEFSTDKDVIDNIESFSASLMKFVDSDILVTFYDALKMSSGNGLYIKNDLALTLYSNITLSSWNDIRVLLSNDYDNTYLGKKKGDAYLEEKEKQLKKIKSIEIVQINDLSNQFTLDKYIQKLKDDVSDIKMLYQECSQRLSSHLVDKSLQKNTRAVSSIKNYLDAVKQFERDLKILIGTGFEAEKNEYVYSLLDNVISEITNVDLLYNMTRNYLTRKPFSTEKFKLNFNSPTLLDGWDRNKEESNLGVLFIKNEKFYLGIMDSSNNKIFRSIPKCNSSNAYKKIDYKLLPGANKMLPKVFFAKSNIDYYSPSEEILNIYSKGTFKKGNDFSLSDCHKLIDFFKQSIDKHPDWSKFDFSFSDTSSYSDISAFYREVEQQGYKINYTEVDASYIDMLVETGKLYLFQIYNKDFSEYSHGNLNLHTVYLKALFNEENLKNVVYKLNGEAEVFYRSASISEEDKIIHTANTPIENKNSFNLKKESVFNYDLIKDKRYTEDQFEFHFPITINFGKPAKSQAEHNYSVNRALKNNKDIHIIGIDRGERNLLYIVVSDRNGNIVEQISLNEIVNGNYRTNYHEILDVKEINRKDARLNWNEIENIKELKQGYLSQVVNVIVQLVLKYNAIICLEDLNMRFMQKRTGKVEKSVYQDFEKMLINKLNLIVTDKSRNQVRINEIGGALKPIQLTAPVTSIKSMGSQTGCIFYVPAYMTSKIDPTTGFTNLFYVKYESRDQAIDFWGKFKAIYYNGADFEFAFDYSNFTDRSVKNDWIISSRGTRIRTYRDVEANNSYVSETVEPTLLLKDLFDKNKISYDENENLIDKIVSTDDKEFLSSLIYYFKLILQMRNSNSSTGEDYIISPVRNSKGKFFDSREGTANTPIDADANGAYNIARKGIWILNNLDESEADLKFKKTMSNKEWLDYAVNNTI